MMLFGINMGFWITLVLITLVVLAMNLVMWKLPPRDGRKSGADGSCYGKCSDG